MDEDNLLNLLKLYALIGGCALSNFNLILYTDMSCSLHRLGNQS